MSLRTLTVGCLLALATCSASADVDSVRNDGYSQGDPVAFQDGFQLGELAAARFVPQIECPCLVTDVSVLFGGGSGTRSIGVKIWNDPDNSEQPGELLRHESRTLTGSDNELQVIDMTPSAVVVNGPFRVGFQFLNLGLPALATDTDNTMEPDSNFVLINTGTYSWFPAAAENMSGDFIIRASIDNQFLTDFDFDGVDNQTDNCINKPNSDQRDTDNDSIGNVCDADVAGPNDCIVNFLDFSAYRDNFKIPGDFDTDNNGDGVTNFIDFAVFASYFLKSPGPSALGCDSLDN